MADPKTYVSNFKLPSGSVVYIKDAEARQRIEEITGTVSGVMHYIGATTTALTDGASTNPIQVDGKAYTPNAGDVVAYGNLEFAWSATAGKWFEFGSTGSLKALAFKDSASGNFTPAGTVSQPTFTGTAGSISVKGTSDGDVAISVGEGAANYTPAGDVSKPTFTGTEGSVSVTGTPAGNVTIGTGEGTANYTPAGSVAVTPTVTASKTTVKPFGTAGTLPSLVFNVNGESLDISWDQGTLPAAGDDVSVATDIESATATASFTGTGVELTAQFAGTSMNSTGVFTPAGDVSKPSFTGTGVDLEAAYTGKETNATGTFTPAGTVSQPTFSGTQGTVTVE